MSQSVQFGIAGFGYAFGDDQGVAEASGSYVTDPSGCCGGVTRRSTGPPTT